MHFTFVFAGNEGCGSAFSLCFVPNPIWFQGTQEILVLDRSSPRLPSNALERLCDFLYDKGASKAFRHEDLSECSITIHPSGHGTDSDLASLLQECDRLKLRVRAIVRLGIL